MLPGREWSSVFEPPKKFHYELLFLMNAFGNKDPVELETFVLTMCKFAKLAGSMPGTY